MYTQQQKNTNNNIVLYLYFIFTPSIENTLVVQYQLVQGCLNYVYITKK